MKATDNLFGRRLRELREAARLTQTELGVKVGVRQNAVWRWEAGRRTPPYRQLRGLAAALGVKVEDLFPE